MLTEISNIILQSSRLTVRGRSGGRHRDSDALRSRSRTRAGAGPRDRIIIRCTSEHCN